MNIAIIFAGGTGQRMHTKTKPKQFLELHGKPIIVYTLEQFENCTEIDKIIIVCLESWINQCWKMIKQFSIKKVVDIIPGGNTGFESRYNGIKRAMELYPKDSIILMHDGVRPIIDEETILLDIETVKKYGNAVTVSPAIETIAIQGDDGQVGEIIDRNRCQLAKAPQCFYLQELYEAHDKAIKEGMKDCIDCAFLMQKYGYKIHAVVGKPENIKITTPIDFFVFRAVIDERENSQVFG